MRYSNELKVGLSIIIAAIILIIGIRYFEDLPIFAGTYELRTQFDDAQGLIRGSTVQVSGVRVGAVDEVQLTPDMKAVAVRFHLDEGVQVPQGSYASISGFQTFGGVRLEIVPGPATNPAVEPGGMIPGRSGGILGNLTDRAPELIDRVDTLLLNAGLAFEGINPAINQADRTFLDISNNVNRIGAQASGAVAQLDQLLRSSNADLSTSLAGLREASTSLNRLVQAEQVRVSQILTNLEGLTGGLNTFSEENSDSLAMAVQNLNMVMTRLNRNLAALETTSTNLDRIIARIDRGEGTIGLLINDPALYNELVGTTRSMNELLEDLQANPRRYLKELQLVDIF